MAYASAIALPIVSSLVILLILPPLCWHIRNRNTGAVAAIIWIITTNSMIFLNALIWPDDLRTYQGRGLCDIEVKLQTASQVGLPASFACILRALAAVMNTKRVALSKTRFEKRRALAIDLIWCFGFPALQMLFHYIVQPNRYTVFGISGCVATVSSNVVAVLLILVPPVIWVMIAAGYAGLIVVRLRRYRQSFQVILASNCTNKSRFLRLLVLCLIWIIANVPLQVYVFSFAFKRPLTRFNWSDIHDSQAWAQVFVFPSYGYAIFDRYIWLGTGIVMFLFFGVGKEALKMYGDAAHSVSGFVSGLRRIGGRNPQNHGLQPLAKNEATWASCSTAVQGTDQMKLSFEESDVECSQLEKDDSKI